MTFYAGIFPDFVKPTISELFSHNNLALLSKSGTVET